MTLLSLILLFLAGLLAGGVNALAGGGSFIVFPALVLVGVPIVVANATNTFAALPGYLSGAIGYWRHLKTHREKLIPYALTAVIGGYLGAESLLRVSDAQFALIVPWLMGLAVIAFAFGNRFNAWAVSRSRNLKGAQFAGIVAIAAMMIGVNFYGGFFNGGHGILLLAALAVAGLSDIHAMNGLKLLLSVVVASIAVARFGFSGSIAWIEGSAAFLGTLIGGYVAARMADRIPAQGIRVGIIIYALILTAIFFWQAYA